MSANINSMFYFGEKPWHKLGTAVDHALNSADALNVAGLNWTVDKKPLFLEGQTSPVPGAFANVRLDTGAILGVVGAQYTVLQNASAFSLADAIVGVKEAMYHTAGALGKGEKIWMLLKANGVIRTTGEDITEKYLLISNSHDGSTTVEIMFTPIRVVCQNTLNAAIKGTANKARVRHTVNMGMSVEEVRKTLGIATSHFDLFEQASQELVKVKFGAAALKDYAKKTGVIPEEDKLSVRAQNIMDEVSRLFETGKGTELAGVKGTAWAAYNAIVEYVDHKRGSDLDKRATSLLFGSGAKIKQAAWDNAVSLIGGRS